MGTYLMQVRKEVIVMDADGSKSGDDSIPLIFSETRLVDDELLRALKYDHFLDDLHCR